MESSRYDELTSLFVKDFIEAQNEVGLTPKFLATALKRLIDAKKTDTFKGTVETTTNTTQDVEGQPVTEEVFRKEDVVIYSKPLEDHPTRRLALQMALNIRGIQTTSPSANFNINNPGTVNLMGAVAKILGDEPVESLGENGEPIDD